MWQVGVIKRVVRGKAIHWPNIFYDLVWINVSNTWRGGLINHMTPFLVNFYCGMGLLTKNEESRFPKERKILKLDTDEGTEEEYVTQAKEITRGAARGPVRVKIITIEEVSERRPAKR